MDKRGQEELLDELAQLKSRIEEIEAATECLSEAELEQKEKETVQKIKEEQMILNTVHDRIVALQKRKKSLQQLHFLQYDKNVSDEDLSKVHDYLQPFAHASEYLNCENVVKFKLECSRFGDVEAELDFVVQFKIEAPQKYTNFWPGPKSGQFDVPCLVAHPVFLKNATQKFGEIARDIDRSFFDIRHGESREIQTNFHFSKKAQQIQENPSLASLSPSREVQDIMAKARISVQISAKVEVSFQWNNDAVREEFLKHVEIDDDFCFGDELHFGYATIGEEDE